MEKVITRYLLKKSTLTLLFNGRNVPSVTQWEAWIFIASDIESLRGLCSWTSGVNSLSTQCGEIERLVEERTSKPGRKVSTGSPVPLAVGIQGPAYVRFPPRPLQHDGI